jgi:hypothetical protein
MKSIPVGKGSFALIDAADYESVSQYKWSLSSDGYARRNTSVNGKRITLQLHHVIFGRQEGMQIDHINGNRLDNRRENLRYATRSQNMQNKVSRNWLGLKGVRSRSGGRYYEALFMVGRKQISLGKFKTAQEAHAAYMKRAQETFGEFATDRCKRV